MRQILLTLVALFATTITYASEPLKIKSFSVEVISPEADVYIATLKTIHNGDPDKVTLKYKVSNKAARILKYDNYDIVDMGSATTVNITVTASDGTSTAHATCAHVTTDMSVDGYYTNEPLWAKIANTEKNRGATFRFVEADPTLPNVLLIGNSISIGYTTAVRSSLAGVANVYRIAENSGSSDKAITSLDLWLSDMEWDVIHINLGLHDLKYTFSQEHQDVPLDRYEENLRAIFARLQATGATVIWAHTTYVPEGVSPRRDLGDDAKYNAVAERVAKEFKNITINDLYTLSKNNVELQQPKNVHYTAAGYKLLSEQVCRYITEALK